MGKEFGYVYVFKINKWKACAVLQIQLLTSGQSLFLREQGRDTLYLLMICFLVLIDPSRLTEKRTKTGGGKQKS